MKSFKFWSDDSRKIKYIVCWYGYVYTVYIYIYIQYIEMPRFFQNTIRKYFFCSWQGFKKTQGRGK